MVEGDSTTASKFKKFADGVFNFVTTPSTYVREKVVEPIQSKNKLYYYHRRLRRVPTIDQCDLNDAVCFYEANEQFKRDKNVDNEILAILRQRRLECEHFYGTDAPRRCTKVTSDYITAETDWFTKYGDLGATGTVQDAYMKQKHRMIWERRHGPVGSGLGTTTTATNSED